MTELQGVDVSKWQGHIDWASAATQIGFAMVKATQGVSEVDAEYAADIGALRAAGDRRGSYHYPDAGDPVAEADFYVDHAGRENGEMQALDIEGTLLTIADPVGWVAAWLGRVIDRTDNVPLCYMTGSTLAAFDWHRVVALNPGLWVASWGPAAPASAGAWPFVIMWQRDDNGQLTGIGGDVDQDVFYGDATVWARYANNRATAPVEPPAPPKHAAPPPAPAPAPPRPPAPAPAPAPTREYTVQAGDTLSEIGARFGCDVAQLVAWNEAAYPSLRWNENLIQIGWTLHVGNSSRPAVYVVQPGDTLSGIADTHGTTWQALAAANAGRYPSLPGNPNYIQAGWTLDLP